MIKIKTHYNMLSLFTVKAGFKTTYNYLKNHIK